MSQNDGNYQNQRLYVRDPCNSHQNDRHDANNIEPMNIQGQFSNQCLTSRIIRKAYEGKPYEHPGQTGQTVCRLVGAVREVCKAIVPGSVLRRSSRPHALRRSRWTLRKFQYAFRFVHYGLVASAGISGYAGFASLGGLGLRSRRMFASLFRKVFGGLAVWHSHLGPWLPVASSLRRPKGRNSSSFVLPVERRVLRAWLISEPALRRHWWARRCRADISSMDML